VTRPARVIFNASAVRANLERVQARAPGRRVLAIVKADAYGHGLVRAARALAAADAFGVASIEEAVNLRQAGVARPIVLLEGPFEAGELAEIAVYGLESVVHDARQVEWFERQDRATPLWIKVDTGMHRLGFAPDEVPGVIARLARRAHPLRLMTHFASAHLRGDPDVERQLRRFDRIDAAGLERCLANSSAIMAWPTAAVAISACCRR
jgi:alanine racemase